MERPPNHLFNLSQSRGGRFILGLLILLVVVLGILVWTTRDKDPEGMDRGLGDGQYYERDKTLLDQQIDSAQVVR